VAAPRMPFGPPFNVRHRHPDWQKRLAALVNSRARKPYRYGLYDCGTFVGEAVIAVTGVAPLLDVELPRGWMALAKFMIANNLNDMEELATAVLGVHGDAEESQSGDVISWRYAGEMYLAVRCGDEAVAPGQHGLEGGGRRAWSLAWAVGR